MIKDKTIKIGKYTLIEWDWFEATKLLNIIAGINISLVMLGIGLMYKGYKPIISGLFAATNLVLIFIIGIIVEIIRKEHAKRLEIKVK